MGQCLASQDSKLQCGTDSLHGDGKWKIVFHFLARLLIYTPQQRVQHERMKRAIYDTQARAAVFIFHYKYVLLELRFALVVGMGFVLSALLLPKV